MPRVRGSQSQARDIHLVTAAVSYTHLDVYKRQVDGVGDWRRGMAEILDFGGVKEEEGTSNEKVLCKRSYFATLCIAFCIIGLNLIGNETFVYAGCVATCLAAISRLSIRNRT